MFLGLQPNDVDLVIKLLGATRTRAAPIDDPAEPDKPRPNFNAWFPSSEQCMNQMISPRLNALQKINEIKSPYYDNQVEEHDCDIINSAMGGGCFGRVSPRK